MNTTFFQTHHAPTGAFSSLTFGIPGVPISIDLEEPWIKASGAMLIGCVKGNSISSLCFGENANNQFEAFNPVLVEEVQRKLTPNKDTFTFKNIRFTTYTPLIPLPDPKKSPINALDCIPGILMEVCVDNTDGITDITGFWGLALNQSKMVYASESENILAISHKDRYEFCTLCENGTYMLRGIDTAGQLLNGQRIVQQNGPTFFCVPVPKGETRKMYISFSVYSIMGSNGTIPTKYYYTEHFSDIRQVSQTLLSHQDYFCNYTKESDSLILARQDGSNNIDSRRAELFSQAVRGYYASSQLLISPDHIVHWNLCEGGYLWRNTMDLCADHLAWELKHNPWVVRSMMEDFLTHYTYHDEVVFPHKEGAYPGGISFTHDMGCYLTYSPMGHSAYERENEDATGFYFYMTTEELLNGIYCICSYILSTGDTAWLEQYPSLLSELITSLENRDGTDASERNGILKAASLRGGNCHLESTTYDALDHSLLDAAGNLYVYIKTWCSLVMLKDCCKATNQEDVATRAEHMLQKCRNASSLFHSDETPWLKANAYQNIPGAISAAAEPLAIPYMLGLFNNNTEAELFSLIKKHLSACFQTGVCIDSKSGALRLSSTSKNTWPSKSVLTLYVAETVLNLKVPESLIENTIDWAQIGAANTTISDQISSDTGEVIGAPYYPRIVTAILWL